MPGLHLGRRVGKKGAGWSQITWDGVSYWVFTNPATSLRSRHGIRDGYQVVDEESQIGGFDLAEGVGWDNVEAVNVSWNNPIDPDYALIRAEWATKPDFDTENLFNDFVVGRKASGVWDKIIKILFFGTPLSAQSVLDWKNPGTLSAEFSATPPTFEAYRGYLGVIANQTFINSKFNAVTHGGTRYTQDSAGFGCYVLNNKTASNTTTMGAGVTAGLSQIDSKVSATGNKLQYIINDTAASFDIVNEYANGFYHLNRSASNAVQIYKNGIRTNKALVSNALPDNEFLGLARKYNATTDRYSDDQIVAMWWTETLSETEVLDLRRGLQSMLVNYGEAKVDITGKTCYYFGDSITRGYDSVDTNQDWVSLITAATETVKDNRGIDSRSLLNGRTPNFEDNYAAEIPAFNAATDGLIAFSFGVVDLYTSTYTATSEFIAVYETIINHTISVKGWPRERILINGLSYTLTNGTLLNDDITPFCIMNKLKYFNPRIYMEANGGIALTFDNVHPSDAGYQVYFEGLLAKFRTWFTY